MDEEKPGEAEMIRRTFKWLAAGLVGLVLCTMYISAVRAAAKPEAEIDPTQKAAILAATIQIRMYAPIPGATDDPAFRRYKLGQGLGTVINWQGESLIVTHNHWGEFLKSAEVVDFLDAQGKLMLELGNAEFNYLVRYSDPGTLILSAPSGLPATAASLAIGRDVVDGETVLIVHQKAEDEDRLEVLKASVSNHTLYRGEPVYNLSISTGSKLIHGDSGGGIWHNGKLAANNWTATAAWLPGITSETGRGAEIPAAYFGID